MSKSICFVTKSPMIGRGTILQTGKLGCGDALASALGSNAPGAVVGQDYSITYLSSNLGQA